MIKIVLLDGSIKEFPSQLTIKDIVTSIDISLEKSTLAGIVDNKVRPIEYLIESDCKLELITKKSCQAWNIVNYTAGLITTKALIDLYPNIKIAQVALNEDGFFIDFKNDHNIREQDLEKIQKNFWQLIKNNINIIYICSNIKDIKKIYQNNKYIIELINKLPKDKIKKCLYLIDKVYLYNTYAASNAKYIKGYKILSLSGVYWKNNDNNEMLQRIYGTAHFSKKLFNEFIAMLDERKKRDHRKIGKDLEIFTFDKLVGSGLPIWLPNGMNLKKEIQNYIRDKEWEYDFIEVETPVIGTSEMYKISGHWDHYKENMFVPMEQNNEISVLRPMACPHHITIYNSKQRSYRDLPLRITEHAILHRYESSGSLTGLERVRMMQLTDSHIFVSNDQIKEEFKRCFQLINEVLKDFNINIDYFSLSLRDISNKEKYFDNDKIWNTAEKMLKESLNELNVKYTSIIGEAAFYGPKLDFQIKTALNHEITVSTLQFDFLLPKKFNIWYIDEKGKKAQPIMIHRGLIGTYERFIAILLEQTKGILPLWLAPRQIVIIPVVSEKHLVYSQKIHNQLKKIKIRSYIDQRDERLSYKIRNSQSLKIPYQIVIGDKEVKNNIITYRKYGSKKQVEIKLEYFIIMLNEIITKKN